MTISIFKAREARRSVSLSVRLRVDQDWMDARICNISSRGMMIACATCFPRGAIVEIRRGQAVAIARIVWTRSEYFGVRLQDPVRIENFIEAKVSEPQRLEDGQLHERRSEPRIAEAVHASSRLQSSALQFAGAVSMAVAGGSMIAIAAAELWGAVTEAVGAALP